MAILHGCWPFRIVEMHPVHDRAFIALRRLRPLAGIALTASDHVQRLKAFPAALVFCCYDQAANIFKALVPFGEIWAYHLDRLLFLA
jgi:hypothetical protein